MTYDKEYFIQKFTEIPESEWGKGEIANKCALYHCGVRNDNYEPTEEASALIRLFGGRVDDERIEWEAVYKINDSGRDIKQKIIKGDTPKQRILNKLNSL